MPGGLRVIMRPYLSLTSGCVPLSTAQRPIPVRHLSVSRVSYNIRKIPSETLPEDPTPAMWQRVAQLLAGTVAASSLVYFVLLADFGEGEHCFMPIRRALQIDAPAWRARLWKRQSNLPESQRLI